MKNIVNVSNLVPHMKKTWVGLENNLTHPVHTVIKKFKIYLLIFCFGCSLSQEFPQQANLHKDITVFTMDALHDATTDHWATAAHMRGAEGCHLL